jgi:hypothetical protein
MSTTDARSELAGRPERPEPAGRFNNHEAVIEVLARDGVARVGRVLETEEIKRVLEWLEAREAENDELVKELQPDYDTSSDGRRRLGRIRRLFWSDPHFWADIFVRSRIVETAVDFVGPNATLLFHTAFMKPSSFGSEVTLHQDQGVWPWDLPYVTTMWIALTPSKVTNGSVIGYPGSHRNGLIPHVLADGTVIDKKTGVWPRSWPSVPPSRFVDVTPVPFELEPGEAVIWHHYFVHGSAENHSGRDRKGMAIVFADFTEASRPGFPHPDIDHTGRRMEPTSVTKIRDIAGANRISESR